MTVATFHYSDAASDMHLSSRSRGQDRVLLCQYLLQQLQLLFLLQNQIKSLKQKMVTYNKFSVLISTSEMFPKHDTVVVI